jgi:hypothetical protein
MLASFSLTAAILAGSWSLNVEVDGQVYVIDHALTFEDCANTQKLLSEHPVAKQWSYWCEEETSWVGHFGRSVST